MSFKSFSSAQTAPAKDKSDDKVKTVSENEAASKTDKASTDSVPPSKS